MKHSFETIKISCPQPHIMLVTLNRPERLNAFNTQMAKDIYSFFKNLIKTEPLCRAVIVTGSGKKAFSAGGDLKERLGMTEEAWHAQHVSFENMIQSILECKIPVIGAVNGIAYGGGCELVSAFDFSYASKNAIFAQTETKIGIIPGIGGTQNLTRAVGERRAKELIFSGKTFSAKQAFKWGLINSIFSPEELMNKIFEIASQIVHNAPIAIKQSKMAIHEGLQLSLTEGMKLELECYNKTIPTKDRTEGVVAFSERRKPIFKGE